MLMSSQVGLVANAVYKIAASLLDLGCSAGEPSAIYGRRRSSDSVGAVRGSYCHSICQGCQSGMRIEREPVSHKTLEVLPYVRRTESCRLRAEILNNLQSLHMMNISVFAGL